jgi:hypothetical protein
VPPDHLRAGLRHDQGGAGRDGRGPVCGFNLGSTVYRATPDKDKPAKKFVFESPVVRLMSDFGYTDVYEDGFDILDDDWEGTLPRKSIVIYRYYDEASTLLGTGKTPSIEDFARGLNRLVLRVRDLVCQRPENGIAPADFRCYLVAHSMGGLVCRAFLQNPELGTAEARACVDKVFTYATPHNGIEMAGANVPEWLSAFDMKNFNREYMAEYLNVEKLYHDTGRVDWLPEGTFPADRFFCLVGTNRADYQVAMGLSRTFSGHGGDGLVKIDNAAVWGRTATGAAVPCATAYTYRSHSGTFGIVNAEESYQNLRRFLFGDVRADLWVDVDTVLLPPDIQGKAVDALYQFELLASPRGKRWYLSRRTAEEDSVACRSHKDLTDPGKQSARSIYLSSVFLDNRARVDPNRPSLAYGLSLGVRVPDYEVERKFWANGHYEGAYLFQNSLVIEVVLPAEGATDWGAKYGWQSQNPGPADTPLPGAPNPTTGKLEFTIPFGTGKAPGITGRVRFVVGEWNA